MAFDEISYKLAKQAKTQLAQIASQDTKIQNTLLDKKDKGYQKLVYFGFITDYRSYYNADYTTCAYSPWGGVTALNCKIKAGKQYKIIGYTEGDANFPLYIVTKNVTLNPSGGVQYSYVFNGTSTSGIERHEAIFIAESDGYVFITALTSDIVNCGVWEYIEDTVYEKKSDPIISINQWYNKKVVWIGTSVPFGSNATKSYAKEVSDKLGFTLVNASVPGLAIHTDNSGNKLTYGSLCLSKSQYASQGVIIPDNPIPYVVGGNYNDYYRTYENVFSPDNADADLYVFDVVPNNNDFNNTDWDLFDKVNWEYTDQSNFESHCTTFFGALLFLIDKMYTLNPNARMLLLTGSEFNYQSGINAFGTMNSTWNIPFINIYNKINLSPKSKIKVLQNNGSDMHPTTFGHELLGAILANELLLVR